MSLQLAYPDKYWLSSALAKANTDRVFIETEAPPRLGERAAVNLHLEGVALMAMGHVVGLRKGGPRFSGGVWVRFDDEEVDKVRRFLGLTQTPARPPVGRRWPRQACALNARFQRPDLPDLAVVRNLSETGALLETAAAVKPGALVELSFELDDGTSLRLKAELAREGREGRFVGVRFLEVPELAAAALSAQVARLATRPPTARPTVLVADDDPSILTFLTKALNKFGYEVTRARNGTEALSAIREQKPGVVVLDILMPDVDGVTICKVMRSDVELAALPVIFFSALNATRLHDLAEEAGATDFLCKPATLAELLNLVGTHLKPQPAA